MRVFSGSSGEESEARKSPRSDSNRVSRIDEPGIPELIPGARPVPHAKANRDRIVVEPGTTPVKLVHALALRSARVVEAHVSPPSPSYSRVPENPGEAFRGEAATGLWLYATVRAPERGPLALRAIWEAQLLAGVLADRLDVAGLSRLSNAVITLKLPDGRVVTGTSGLGNVVRAQDFGDAPDDAIEAEIRSNAAEAGIAVDSIEVVRMDQPAPAVVATTHDLNVKKNPDDVLRQIFPDPSRYEGIYARINDSDGKIAVIQASSFRTGVHIQWVPPALARKRFAGGYREVEDRISE